MCGIIGLATIYEYFYNFMSERNRKDTDKPFIICFSLISNVKNLFSLKKNSEENNDYTSLNGIKVMATLWIVISNVYFLGYQPQLKALISQKTE